MTPISQFHFAEPRWLWLAVLLPIALLLLMRYAAWARQGKLATLIAPELKSSLTRSHSPLRRAIKNTLLLTAAAGFGLALARPQWGALELASRQPSEDVVFVLDCSRSMLATDISPNRLERAKLAMIEFVRQRGPGRVGLVAFAGQAFLQCPLTFDHDAFEDSLRAVTDKTIPVPGTDIGRALSEAMQAMEKQKRRNVIILLTDGEDLVEAGAKVAGDLAKRGVVIFTVGVGTENGSEIRVINEQNQPELVRGSDGAPVRTRLEEQSLRAIATATKGSYFPLGGLGEGLAQVRLALESGEGLNLTAPTRRVGVDRYHPFVATVLLLLVLESLLGTRRRTEPTAT
jgi:Ca-activated chloride channel family protein